VQSLLADVLELPTGVRDLTRHRGARLLDVVGTLPGQLAKLLLGFMSVPDVFDDLLMRLPKFLSFAKHLLLRRKELLAKALDLSANLLTVFDHFAQLFPGGATLLKDRFKHLTRFAGLTLQGFGRRVRLARVGGGKEFWTCLRRFR